VRADELLAGPRGRRLCFELLGLASFGLSTVPTSQVAEQVTRIADELRADEAAAGPRTFQALRESAWVAMYWQEPDECDQALGTPHWAQALRPVAEAVAAGTGTAWWTAPVDLDDQHVAAFLDEGHGAATPALTGAVGALSAWRSGIDEQNAAMREWRARTHSGNVSGTWWSSPIMSAIPSTMRAVARFGPALLWLVEDYLGFGRAATWPVHPARPPRVFEVTDEHAWADLVRQYPLDVSDARGPDWQRATGRAGAWLIPDWQAVAGDFDAVHLTVSGYLSAAGRDLAVSPGRGSVIAGWAPDTTYWLTDILAITGPVTDWALDEDDNRWHPG
jgi:hypothetical protein